MLISPLSYQYFEGSPPNKLLALGIFDSEPSSREIQTKTPNVTYPLVFYSVMEMFICYLLTIQLVLGTGSDQSWSLRSYKDLGLPTLKPKEFWANWDEMITLPAYCLPVLVNICSSFLLMGSTFITKSFWTDRRQTAGGCSELTKDRTVSLACGLINWKRSRILHPLCTIGMLRKENKGLKSLSGPYD